MNPTPSSPLPQDPLSQDPVLPAPRKQSSDPVVRAWRAKNPDSWLEVDDDEGWARDQVHEDERIEQERKELQDWLDAMDQCVDEEDADEEDDAEFYDRHPEFGPPGGPHTGGCPCSGCDYNASVGNDDGDTSPANGYPGY